MTDRREVNLGGSTFDSRLREAGFRTYSGWNNELAAELVEVSKDPVIMSSTPRDHTERFTSVTSAHNWNESNDRSVYTLRSANALAGIFWLSSEEYDGADKTIAIRLYEEARGKGLASLFGKTALYHHERWVGYGGDTWLETGLNNFAAQHTFKILGFEQTDDSIVASHRLRMKRPGTKSRTKIQEAREKQSRLSLHSPNS